MTKKIAIAVHGGAGPDSDFIRKHKKEFENTLREAVDMGYVLLEEGFPAIKVVERVVRYFEDCEIYNAGRGAAITEGGKVEMCACIMDGKNRDSGAVAIIRNVKNPISLAKAVYEQTSHRYLGNMGAWEFANSIGAEMKPDTYFVTEHAIEDWKKKKEEIQDNTKRKFKHHGTVGCVALDLEGNIAAATSTGGTEYDVDGRIGDSSMVGIGAYANNKTCAVSSTGDGEYVMKAVLAYDISAVVEYKSLPLKEACHWVMHEKNKDSEGDMGVIAVDTQGNIAIEFNSERMLRGWRTSDSQAQVGIYPDDTN